MIDNAYSYKTAHDVVYIYGIYSDYQMNIDIALLIISIQWHVDALLVQVFHTIVIQPVILMYECAKNDITPLSSQEVSESACRFDVFWSAMISRRHAMVSILTQN